MKQTQNDQTTNILLCGIGGQGILTMAELISRAAVIEGYHVKKSEVHGMAQRGGSVESHVRFGNEVFSPLTPKGEADFLVCLHANEHEKMKEFLKKTGIDLFDHLEKINNAVGNQKYLNSAMLGVLASKLNLSKESWEKSFELLLARKNLKENLEAFNKGFKGI